MRLPGYCTVCHRVQQVRVSGAGMAMLHRSGVAQGICRSCEQDEDDDRVARSLGLSRVRRGLYFFGEARVERTPNGSWLAFATDGTKLPGVHRDLRAAREALRRF